VRSVISTSGHPHGIALDYNDSITATGLMGLDFFVIIPVVR
jgi:hypothetical protein